MEEERDREEARDILVEEVRDRVEENDKDKE